MKLKKITKRTLSVSIVIIISQLLAITAFACNTAFFSGTYTANAPSNQSNLKLLLFPSAITPTLISSTYNNPGWNSSSPVINVSITNWYQSIPNVDSYFPIYGEYWSNSSILGETRVYDANGNPVSANSNWHRVSININTNSAAFNTAEQARKTFIHEVGHALKLSH